MTPKLTTRTLAALGMLFGLVACNEIAGIHEPTLRGAGGGAVSCSTIADCKVEEPECRTATCESGACVFHDATEGTTLSEQTAGDCVERVCNGAGKVRLSALVTDVPDDGNPCTLDTCDGSTPKFTPQAQVECYTGAPGTLDQGICKAGTQSCDADGKPAGGCVGEIVPQPEACDPAKLDENCDGQANEGFPGCTCGDGVVDIGEECDDGNIDDTDGCTNTCKLMKCGDGLTQPGIGEECDDGNTDDTDGCTNGCKLPKCGDGLTQPGIGEECDDGNIDDTDGCTNGCELPTVVAVAAGERHTCALLSDGRVKCWGFNLYGQLGLGDTQNRGDGPDEMGGNLPAVDLGTGKTAIAVSAGANHTCALLNDNTVKCWGSSLSGQLGLGDTIPHGDGPNEMGDNLPAVDFGAGKTAMAIDTGGRHTCALLNDGAVKCWGYNSYGQLGLGDKSHRGDGSGEMGDNLPAVDLGTGKVAVAISAGANHTCARLNDGTVKCWGYNNYGQLGLGDTIYRGDGSGEMGDALPTVDLGAGKTATGIDTGHNHTCARLSDGTVKCWGGSLSGQLGLGDKSHRGDAQNEMGDNLPAVDLGAGKTAAAVSVGDGHTCARLNDGTVKCWGGSSSGQLGLGDANSRGDAQNEMGDNLLAVNLGIGRTATAIDAGDNHTCARLSDGSIKCWGSNAAGQLGLGDANNRGDDQNEMGDVLPSVKLFSSQW